MNLYKVLKILILAMLVLPLSSYTQPLTNIQPERDGTHLNTKQLLKKGINIHTDAYCNTRFDFCFRYPSDFFTEKMQSDNKDGIFLNAPEEGVKITAYAYHAIDENIQMNWENSMKLLQEKTDEAEVTVNMIANDNILQAEYLNDGHFVHTYTQLYDDKWIIIEIQVENRAGTEDERMFKYLSELVTYSLEISDAIN